MTVRLEEAIKRLSPQQMDALIQHVEAMANQPRPRGRRLRLDWAGCIDSEHTSGMEAQQAAMNDWTRAIERGSHS
jgi:hypothetical protein